MSAASLREGRTSKITLARFAGRVLVRSDLICNKKQEIRSSERPLSRWQLDRIESAREYDVARADKRLMRNAERGCIVGIGAAGICRRVAAERIGATGHLRQFRWHALVVAVCTVQDVQREHGPALRRAGITARGTDCAGVVVERTGDEVELTAADENRAAESGASATAAFEYSAAAKAGCAGTTDTAAHATSPAATAESAAAAGAATVLESGTAAGAATAAEPARRSGARNDAVDTAAGATAATATAAKSAGCAGLRRNRRGRRSRTATTAPAEVA